MRHAVQLVMQNSFPDILVVVQIALEGAISRESARSAIAAGTLPSGDLLPWMIGQQFQDQDFPRLSGLRIVRIAAHPEALSAGYGSKAVKELERYFVGGYAGAFAPLQQ
jgi:N-acetyltransferase 10